MKSIYAMSWTSDNSETLESMTLNPNMFDNFSLERFIGLDRGMHLRPSFKEAWRKKPNNAIGLIILEYSLSEDNLFDLHFGSVLNIKPINSWYFAYNEKTKELEEVKPTVA